MKFHSHANFSFSFEWLLCTTPRFDGKAFKRQLGNEVLWNCQWVWIDSKHLSLNNLCPFRSCLQNKTITKGTCKLSTGPRLPIDFKIFWNNITEYKCNVITAVWNRALVSSLSPWFQSFVSGSVHYAFVFMCFDSYTLNCYRSENHYFFCNYMFWRSRLFSFRQEEMLPRQMLWEKILWKLL